MIEQNVQVVRCQDERMWVRLGSQSGCTACENGEGCGAGVFAKLLQKKPVIMELVREDASIKVGQMVTLALKEHVYLKLVFAYYGWPLLAAIAGAVAGHSIAVWAQAGSGLIDFYTLVGGLLTGGLVMRSTGNKNKTEAVLKSMHMSILIPPVNPNMCNRSPLDE